MDSKALPLSGATLQGLSTSDLMPPGRLCQRSAPQEFEAGLEVSRASGAFPLYQKDDFVTAAAALADPYHWTQYQLWDEHSTE